MRSQDMKTQADALRWALNRIKTSKLGEGEYFARAEQILAVASDEADALQTAAYAEGRRDERAEMARLLKEEATAMRSDHEASGDGESYWMGVGIDAVADTLAGIDSATGKPATPEMLAAISIFDEKDAASVLAEMDRAMLDFTMRAARGECAWVCADCCMTFSAGMPDECAHGHQSCTDIIRRDKADATGA
jgi:hypothetical protein